MKQAGRLWNNTLIKFFENIGFIPTNADTCILADQKSNVFIIIGVYVNDLALVLLNQDGLDWLKGQLIQKLNMKNLGKAKTIIG